MSRPEPISFPAPDLLGFKGGDLVQFFAARAGAVTGAADETASLGVASVRNLRVREAAGEMEAQCVYLIKEKKYG